MPTEKYILMSGFADSGSRIASASWPSDGLYHKSGTKALRVFDYPSQRIFDATPVAPSTAPTVATNGAGNLTGVYTYWYSDYNSVTTWESDLSPLATVSCQGNAVAVSDILTDANSVWTGVDQRRVYRSVAGGATPRFLATISDNTTTTLADDATDDTLGAAHSQEHAPLATDADFLIFALGRLWGARTDASPRILYPSTPEGPYFDVDESFDAGRDRNQKIKNLSSLRDWLMVFLTDSVVRVYIVGTDPVEFNQETIDDRVGCISEHEDGITKITLAGRAVLFFPSEKGVYACDGTDVEYIGEPLEDLWATLDKDALIDAHGAYDKENNHYVLWVPRDGQTANDLELRYDLQRRKWVPQTDGRLVVGATEILGSTRVNDIYYMDHLGYAWKINSTLYEGETTGTLSGTATGGSPTTIDMATASFKNTGAKLHGVPVSRRRGTTWETSFITSNGSTQLTVAPAFSTATVSWDLFFVGYIAAEYQFRPIDGGFPTNDKLLKFVRLTHDNSAVVTALEVERRLDMATNADKIFEHTITSKYSSVLWIGGDPGAGRTGQCKNFSLRFKNWKSGQPFNLISIEPTFDAVGVFEPAMA